MLKQNLNDKCYSMADIFSFAEKVILDFNNKSEGDKFLFLYCITAKLLSNRLYDYETAEDKINCLLNRIPKGKEAYKQELTNQLNQFIKQELSKSSDDKSDIIEIDTMVENTRSFFSNNRKLLSNIYGDGMFADLLLFCVQICSKTIFAKEKNLAFIYAIEEAKIKESEIDDSKNDVYRLIDGTPVNSELIKNGELDDKDPNRNFSSFIVQLNKQKYMNLEIFDQKSKNNEYRSKAFRLYIDPKGNKTSRKEKNDMYKMLDIDKILEKKFSFKKMNCLSFLLEIHQRYTKF